MHTTAAVRRCKADSGGVAGFVPTIRRPIFEMVCWFAILMVFPDIALWLPRMLLN